MTAIPKTLLFTAMILGAVRPTAAALPEFLEMLNTDPYRRPGAGGCVTCHVNGADAGPRNEFGQAFEAGAGRITPLLRSQFPDHFAFQTTSAGDAQVHFVDPGGAAVVLEVQGERFLIDLVARNVAELPIAAAGPEPAAAVSQPAGPSPAPAQGAAIPVDERAREGVVFGSRVINLPNAKATPDGGIEFLIGHRFMYPLFDTGSPGRLLGFDSSAQITFGVDVGVKEWLSLSALRSNDRTIGLGSAAQLSTQGDSAPVTAQLRVGVDGRDNFSQQYAPYVQFVVSRTFGDRFSFILVPGVAFNTRNDSALVPPDLRFGAEHDYTLSLGIGAGLRVMPTVSIVGEYVPRLSGFRGDNFDRPAVSFGVQKSTFRHTFEFVVSNTLPMATTQYTVNGTDEFKVGFNIYRRLR